MTACEWSDCELHNLLNISDNEISERKAVSKKSELSLFSLVLPHRRLNRFGVFLRTFGRMKHGGGGERLDGEDLEFFQSDRLGSTIGI
jgi:hypothetical protein